MEPLEIEATVRTKNQVTTPQPAAARPSYVGALAGVFGTTEQNVAYVRDEREAWD